MITLESSLKFILPVGIAILNLGTSGLVAKKKKKKPPSFHEIPNLVWIGHTPTVGAILRTLGPAQILFGP